MDFHRKAYNLWIIFTQAFHNKKYAPLLYTMEHPKNVLSVWVFPYFLYMALPIRINFCFNSV